MYFHIAKFILLIVLVTFIILLGKTTSPALIQKYLKVVASLLVVLFIIELYLCYLAKAHHMAKHSLLTNGLNILLILLYVVTIITSWTTAYKPSGYAQLIQSVKAVQGLTGVIIACELGKMAYHHFEGKHSYKNKFLNSSYYDEDWHGSKKYKQHLQDLNDEIYQHHG